MPAAHNPGDDQEQRGVTSRPPPDWRPNGLLYLIPVGMMTTFVGVGFILFQRMTGIVWAEYTGIILLLLATCIWTVASILVVATAISGFIRWVRGKEAEDPD